MKDTYPVTSVELGAETKDAWMTRKRVIGVGATDNINDALSVSVKGEDTDGSGMEGIIGEVITEQVSNDTRLSIKCKPFNICYSGSDCHGGHCLGAFVGTCNCKACLDLWLCEDDAACGGLKGACSNITNSCDCNAGFKAAGFPFFFDALRGLCNRKACSKENQAQQCFGLPCHFGRCTC